MLVETVVPVEELVPLLYNLVEQEILHQYRHHKEILEVVLHHQLLLVLVEVVLAPLEQMLMDL